MTSHDTLRNKGPDDLILNDWARGHLFDFHAWNHPKLIRSEITHTHIHPEI